MVAQVNVVEFNLVLIQLYIQTSTWYVNDISAKASFNNFVA